MFASQSAAVGSLPRNLDGRVDVLARCGFNRSMYTAQLGNPDRTPRKQANQMHFSSVPFRAIVVESLLSGRCSRAYAEGWSLFDRSTQTEILPRTSHSGLGKSFLLSRRACDWHC